VLSSDVELSPGPDLAIVVVPGDIASVQFMAWPGPDDRIGHTLMARGEVEPAREALRGGRGIVEATRTDAEVFRIRRGVPRFGVDFGDDWLPAEAGLDDLVDTTKGCFLGQESVAKVRNLGHPPRVIQSFAASDPLTPMAPIVADGERVGRITSVALNDDGSTACIGWVRWDARDAQVAAENGLLLTRRSAA